MRSHSYSVSVVVGGQEGWILWDRRLQSYAVIIRLFGEEFGAGRDYPPRFVRHGTRLLEYPTPEALGHDLVARGLSFAPGSRAAIDELACSVEAREGSVRLAGLTSDDGSRRIFCLPPAAPPVELQPSFAHPGRGFSWGDRSAASYDTAVALVRCALGPMPPDEVDGAALGLVVEVLGEAGPDFLLSAPGLCGWFLADEPLVATIRPADRRSLHRRLGLGAAARSLVEESSAAATPAGAGWSGFDRHR